MTTKKRPAGPMFAETLEDLPLFSATPLEVEEKPWNPQPRREEQPTDPMFPELERVKLCGHLGGMSFVPTVGGGFSATCNLCGVHAIGKTPTAAGDALITGPKGPIIGRSAATAPDAAGTPEPPAEPCRHLGEKNIREQWEDETRYYIAGCALCGVRGPRRKTKAGAKTALVNDQ